MSNIILHHNGVYNIYSTVSDNPLYEHGLTLEQLTEAIRWHGGQEAIDDLPRRLAHAHATGSSAPGETLADCISCNCAGSEGEHLSVKEFIHVYLTL